MLAKLRCVTLILMWMFRQKVLGKIVQLSDVIHLIYRKLVTHTLENFVKLILRWNVWVDDSNYNLKDKGFK